MILTFDESAFKHGITADEITEVLADSATEECEDESSRQGNYRVMYVGFTMSGKLLEVGIECIDSPEEIFLHVYHADQATPKYIAYYDKVKRR